MIDAAPLTGALRFPARPRRLAPLPALAWWTVVVLALGCIALRTWYRLEVRADSALIFVATITGFVVVVIAGLAAWAGRPDSRIGVLLVAWGMINLTGGIYDHEYGFLLLWSFLNTPLIGVVFAHALLTYPSGRATVRVERVFLIVIYATVSLWVLYALVAEPAWIADCTQETCPSNPVLIRPNVAAAWVFWWSQRAAMVALGLWFVVLMVLRLRRSAPAERHAVMPIAAAAAVPVVAFLLPPVLDASMLGPGWWWWVSWWFNRIGMFTVPVAMAVGLLTSRLARANVADLLVRLRHAPIDALRLKLAELLRDPTLEIALPSGEGYVDINGRPVAVGDARRARADLGHGALVLYDPAVKVNDVTLFDAALAAVRLAFENSRLTAQVQAQLGEVNRSRSRLVTAAYEERRRLERDLHDGAQQSLLGVGMSLQMARREVPDGGPAARLLEEATSQLQDSLAELRSLARGLTPAMLAERGLIAALTELARRMRIPVDLDVQPTRRPAAEIELTAYYVVAEALQNVAKHSRATRASVVCHSEGGSLQLVVSDNGVGGADALAGTGLRGLADRVAAMNGHVSVESPPDGGTRIVVDLPYVVDPVEAGGGSS